MATKLTGSSTGGPAINFKAVIVGLDKTSDEFKQARKDINVKLRDAVNVAGEREALPYIKTAAPRWIKASLYVKRDRTTVYVASRLRGTLNRAAGLLEFGGTIVTPLRVSEGKKGMPVGGGRFRATVTKPRKIKGKKYIVSTLDRRRPMIDDAILVELMKAFDGLEHTP